MWNGIEDIFQTDYFLIYVEIDYQPWDANVISIYFYDS